MTVNGRTKLKKNKIGMKVGVKMNNWWMDRKNDNNS